MLSLARVISLVSKEASGSTFKHIAKKHKLVRPREFPPLLQYSARMNSIQIGAAKQETVEQRQRQQLHN